jgi:molybdate ABC transporter permease protein
MVIDLSPLWISLKVATIATIATSLLGIFTAYRMIGYRGRWRSLIEGVLISPLILPPTVVGFFLLLLFGRTGVLGQLMQQFDFTIIFTWYSAVIAAIVVSFPLIYKTALAAFEQIDSSLLQVARTLGASERRIFFQILLPLAIPGLLAGTILAFARSLGEFGATLMLAGNIPGQTQTMPMAIYYAVEAGKLYEAWFWAIAIMIISLSSLMVVHLWQRQYEHKIYGQQAGLRESYEPVNRGGNATPPSLISAGSQRSLHSAGLCVDITKQMSAFNLDMSFTTQQESLGILGGSGSGKSMTLRCIAGVETPTRGRIVLNGKTLFDSSQQINLPSSRRKVGLVFQNYALFPHMTVAQNIAFGLRSLSKPLRQQQVQQHLARIQMQEMGDHYPHQLSGGQQQRVALARALAIDPEALLLDEPFSALDTYLRSQMEHQLLEVLSDYQGVTLFVTHNLEEAYRVCDKLLVVSGGKAIAHDVKHQIFEYPKTVRVAQLTGCKNFSQAIAQDNHFVEAIDWGISLRVLEAIPDRLTDIGIRAHQISITSTPHGDNTYPCWLATTSETPHRITLFLKFNAPSTGIHDYHIQVEMFKEKWHTVKEQPFPWSVQLDAARLILMVD